jgi:hypothetical protein
MSQLLDPPRWTEAELEAGRQRAIADFRRERVDEPIEAYRETFEEKQSVFEELLEQTVDLSRARDQALDILSDARLLEAFRYLAGPPISEDDLRVLAEATRLSRSTFRADPALPLRVVDTVLAVIDRQRFPWVTEGREPTEAERASAVLASAALLAAQRAQTRRRNTGKKEQEQRVEELLLSINFKKVKPRTVNTMADAPVPGEFCRESKLAGRKADRIASLWDHRLMPIECKVSNSQLNSIKRLNNDAAVKAYSWREDLGDVHVVPTAVLSGVFGLDHLLDAQRRGLTLFWAHDLGKLAAWIDQTKPPLS